MSHIEFTGIAGVGKTTIYSRLIESMHLYAGKDSGGIRRLSPLVDKTLNLCPSQIEPLLEWILWRFIKNQYYRGFKQSNPGFNELIQKIYDLIDTDQKGFKKYMKKTVSEYYFGYRSILPDEILCIDEGFYHRAASISVRRDLDTCGEYELPEEWYFNSVPEPDTLIFVNARDSTIQKRKKKRDGKSYDMCELQRIRCLINELCNKARQRGINVIQINNEQDTKITTKRLLNKLHRKRVL